MSVRQLKLNFSSLPVIKALSTIKCGFELETQSVNGLTYDDMTVSEEPQLNEDAYQDEIDRRQRKFWTSDIAAGARTLFRTDAPSTGNIIYICGVGIKRSKSTTGRHGILNNLLEQYAISNDCADPIAFYSLIPTPKSIADIAEELQYDLTDLKAAWSDAIRQSVDSSEYYESTNGEGELDLSVPRGIEAKHDGSVEGPEFVVAGEGTSANQFSVLLSRLFKQYNLEVDTRCSFHVHLSVPGIKHTYGPMLQCYMMEYLINNLHRVPESVRERWCDDTNYFKPNLSTDKYTFINFHSDYKTWEFRCFGNVSNHKDGMRCLKLAVESLQYAYKVSLGVCKSQFKTPQDWSSDVFKFTVRQGDGNVSIADYMKKQRTDQYADQSEAA